MQGKFHMLAATTMARAGHAFATLVTPPSNPCSDYSRTLPVRTCTGNLASVEPNGKPTLKSKVIASSQDGLLTSKMVHLALPVRWSLVGQGGQGLTETACTYDIHPQGARLLSSRAVNVGDLVVVQRGRNKALCQVLWAADPASQLRGQFSVQCVEGRTPWDDELRQMEEQYQPVILDGSQYGFLGRRFGQPEINRRRRPRFNVEGQAEVIAGVQHVDGEVQQISEYGARISTTRTLRPGSDFRLKLNVLDIRVALKAQVKYLVNNLEMGVEFQEIRRGDRPLLSYVLSKLRTNRVEEFVDVEVVTERMAAFAG